MGRPSTTTSARLSSSIRASECSITACCAALRSPGLARNAPKRPASRWGIGSSARSRTMTCPSGFDWRQAAMKRSVRRLDWPPSEKMLDLICRRVFMAYRSEEHTSELQSLAYLVCRLLLEKKKKKIINSTRKNLKKIASIIQVEGHGKTGKAGNSTSCSLRKTDILVNERIEYDTDNS